MCDLNTNILIDLNFYNSDDSINWETNSNNPIYTDNGKLVLSSSNDNVFFDRVVGSVDNENNRIQIKCNFDVENITDTSEMEVNFQLLSQGNILHTGCVPVEIENNNTLSYYLDRTFSFDENINGDVVLRITAVIGWQNNLLLNDLKIEDFNFCPENVRTYFILDSVFKNALTSKAAAMELTQWKVNGVETLTEAFFSEVTIEGGLVENDWRYGKANLDGTNRSGASPYNTFNPFIREFGLSYDENNFFGGLPTGTTTGSDYGEGIMKIGFEKPSVLNGQLIDKKGAFFIDIDYTKSLKIIFNVIINKRTTELYNEPDLFREYKIEWNANTCEKTFCYTDKRGVQSGRSESIPEGCVNVLANGFLSGLTGVSSQELIFNQDTKLVLYFDSSGSMNETLNPLIEMKNTLLKDRLIGFYNNDDDLYNESVTIKTRQHERLLHLLNMENDIPPSGNVVVMVFQDEALPVYYLSDISQRRPQYNSDISALRYRLDSFSDSYYRGIIFQIVGSDSEDILFADFVNSIENGVEPYNDINGLSDKDEFIYNYNVKNGGTPQYYLDLIVTSLQNLGYNV